MSTDASKAGRILGSLRAIDGKGVVRIEERFDAQIGVVWSAITDPGQLARWHAKVEGDLRPGGEFRIYVESDDVEGTGRVVACEPSSRFVVTTKETEESWRKGQGVPPFDETLEITLTAVGDQTALVAEVRGLPLEPIAFYGAGWQLHAERLSAFLAGRELSDTEARFEELVPAYQTLAAQIGP
jgi:uncharacterized protein YndB with AHSA1/START domain